MYLNEMIFKFTFVLSKNVQENAIQNFNNNSPFRLANISNKV